MSSHLDPTAPIKGKPTKQLERQLKRETKTQIVSYFLMIAITSMAFISIATDAIPSGFAIPFILLLAGIQVIFQLYVFMHMGEKKTSWVNIMIWSGMLIAALTVGALMFLIGIVKY
ncbi:cytochrome C oxidase subunit IV family protein [Salisediminibacterium selenitireducens]|uniref:Cytochrome C oxidase subunit IV n=1 Tax=Bacillus selenitireducens (strain ATCC 700615 / DSM 15326 / MLS10) TaxID=439292 RepID=D6XTK0_BACIE|nr:cytochrome C oxidase subunit IV family protein [Salisediminibacterium selenitireducens]ADH99136.1 cytochrome C oxidase subunit IV [[Bacillus] selenitireducens MLS10]